MDYRDNRQAIRKGGPYCTPMWGPGSTPIYNSFHSRPDGQANPDHIRRDTGVNRVLVSEDYVYFGGEGPLFPDDLISSDGRQICKKGIGRSRFDDQQAFESLEGWIRSLGVRGYQGAPYEWLTLRD